MSVYARKEFIAQNILININKLFIYFKLLKIEVSKYLICL